MQGGDFVKSDGSSGEAIYEGGTFNDENFELLHDRRGTLSMANLGPDTNSVNSQFFICFDAMPHLDGKNCVFGHVRPSSLPVLDVIEDAGSESGVPINPVTIVDCGLLPSETQIQRP